MLSTHAREAIKTSLAFVLAYGVALSTGWMSPMWAGLTVVVIALPTAGQSLQKGMLRLAGTVPGCAAAFVVLALAPQSRWLALLLICAWMFVTTYMMLSRPRTAYTWNVAGFTALIIMTGPFQTTAELFARAQTRTVATVVGIVTYAVVTTFLWPRSNAGAIRKALGDLLATQHERFRALRSLPSHAPDDSGLRSLQLREVQQLAALDQALQAEGSESYEVREVRPELVALRDVCGEILDCLDRLETSVPTGGVLRTSFRGVDPFLDEIDARFMSMADLLTGAGERRALGHAALSPDRESVRRLAPLDRAAVIVARSELRDLEKLTAEAAAAMTALVDRRIDAERRRRPSQNASPKTKWAPALYDLDHLRGALLVAVTTAAGFLLWVFVDPPGHANWVMLPPILAMMVASRQQLSATVFIGPTAIALALGIAVYVFVLPKISTFAELGVVLFAAMFLVNYFTQGIGQLAGMIGVLMGISVQSPQSYSFAAMANQYVFTLSAFVLVYAMSYFVRSPRPEKAVLYLVRRFFRSARFLVANSAPDGPFARWRAAWHLQEVHRLPSKIDSWSKAIDYRAFPTTTPERVEALVARMEAVAYRLDELLDARARGPGLSLAAALADDLSRWRARLSTTLDGWAASPESPAADALHQYLREWRKELDRRIEALSTGDSAASPSDEDWRRFYNLLGGYRGVSGTLLAYGDEARLIDWASWREERFS